MKQPDAPFVELNFYFASRTERDALLQVLTAVVDRGATFTGEGRAHKGAAINGQPFGSITSELLQPVAITSLADVQHRLDDPATRLVQVYLANVTGTVSDTIEIVTFASISSEAAKRDRHPVSILTEGEVFTGTLRNAHTKRAQRVGLRLYQQFRALVEQLDPSYAAITFEYGMECPTDLQADPRSYAFRDFYISRSYMRSSDVDRIQAMFSGAYIESLTNGVYISCTNRLNPQQGAIEAGQATQLSSDVARIIATYAARG